MFGFSRGAYTVRSVASLLMLCGIPSRNGDQPIPRFRKAVRDIASSAVHTVLEHGAGHSRAKFEDERLELARRFRAQYGANHESGEVHRSNVSPYFIGVFDTVAALGAKCPLAIGIKIFLAVGAALLASALTLVHALVMAGILSLFGFAFSFSTLAFVGWQRLPAAF